MFCQLFDARRIVRFTAAQQCNQSANNKTLFLQIKLGDSFAHGSDQVR
jgi:hypothetical protein